MRLQAELEEAKRTLEDESRSRSKLANELRNAQADADQLRDQIEEEAEGKAEVSNACWTWTAMYWSICMYIQGLICLHAILWTDSGASVQTLNSCFFWSPDHLVQL